MKTWTVTHPCPHDCGVDGYECEADVVIEYEVGTDVNEFWPIDDDWYCVKGHQQLSKILDKWYHKDAREYELAWAEKLTDPGYTGGMTC